MYRLSSPPSQEVILNQRFCKSFVITKESTDGGAILTSSKVFKKTDKAMSYANKFFNECPDNYSRSAEIYEIKHVLKKTVGHIPKKKAEVLGKD